MPLRGRAAIALNNETMVRLDQGSTLTLGAPTPDDASPLGICSGALYVITRTPRRFKVKTPFVNASVDGTEFLVEVDRELAPGACTLDPFSQFQLTANAEAARVSVVEGVVTAENSLGSVALKSGEMATDKSPPGGAAAVRPRDAATWTLHVPTVLEYQLEAGAALGLLESQQLGDPYRSIRVAAALASLEAIASSASVRGSTWRAGLQLLLGRFEEAKKLLGAVLASDPGGHDASVGDARVLSAIVAVVENDKTEALRQASAALQLDRTSPSAWLALSYAQQADFKIDEALASAKQADAAILPAQLPVEQKLVPNPRRALAAARVAELHMANGDLRSAQAAADLALAANPALARTQWVFGLANLLRIEIEPAKQAFTRAIQLDQTDPLPRLGLGLAKIRGGDLAAGRLELEIAASLDPGNALVRSYLGRAYSEERRTGLASTQFDLAQRADPMDPTPPFYAALNAQASNQPVTALEGLERAIELNDKRAAYRSQSLLDADQSARKAGIARIHKDLGFEQLALVEAVKSLVLDPTNHANRWFMSDALGQQDRQEITRASELLQAQLLQPVSSMPIAPQLAFGNLHLLSAESETRVGYNEYSRLFERDGVRGYLSGFAGNLRSFGDTAVASLLSGRTAFSLGQFRYQTDGFRPNSDNRHDIYNLFAQTDLLPELSLQGEARSRKTTVGDVALRGDPLAFDPAFRRDFRNDTGRVGVRYSPTAGSDILVSLMQGHLRDKQLSPGLDFGDCITDLTVSGDDRGRQYEIQYLKRLDIGSIVLGASAYRLEAETNLSFTDLCRPDQPSKLAGRGQSTYVTGTFKVGKLASVVLGVSKDRIRDANLRVDRWSPRLGLIAELTQRLTLRAASSRSMKPALFASQTLRPTNVLGFADFADDTNGSYSRVTSVALDARPVDEIHTGLERSRRSSAFALDALDTPTFTNPSTVTHVAYVYWAPRGTELALSAKYLREATRVPFDDASSRGIPSTLVTERFPIGLRMHAAPGWVFGATAQWVRQRADIPAFEVFGRRTSFALIDSSLAYRFAGEARSLAIDLRNITNRQFAFQDTSFLAVEPASLPLAPRRTVTVRFSVDY